MIKVGILGTARVARAFLTHSPSNAAIVAIASRDQSKADAFGAEFNIPRRYGSYEQLVHDPDIDAVYIPLPQHLHCKYTIQSAQAGKHVLVEKPAALSSIEVRSMIDACLDNGVVLMEGFMYRFKSVVRRMKEIAASGEIGELNYINFNWCFNIRQLVRSPFRIDRDLGGGSMYDLGIYGIDFVRFMTDEEPRVLTALVQRESPAGADILANVQYQAGGVVANCTSGMLTDANTVLVAGTSGSMFVRAGLAGNSVGNVLQIHMLKGDVLREERFAPENPYIAELEYFARCVQQKKMPACDGENSLKNLLILEAVFASAVEM